MLVLLVFVRTVATQGTVYFVATVLVQICVYVPSLILAGVWYLPDSRSVSSSHGNHRNPSPRPSHLHEYRVDTECNWDWSANVLSPTRGLCGPRVALPEAVS